MSHFYPLDTSNSSSLIEQIIIGDNPYINIDNQIKKQRISLHQFQQIERILPSFNICLKKMHLKIK